MNSTMASTKPHIPLENMKVIARGHAFTLYQVETPAGPREVVARNNGLYQAAKMLLLCIDDDTDLRVPADNRICTLDRLAQTVIQSNPVHFKVFLLASHRPITHFETMPFRASYQIELPGGVLEYGEDNLQGAIRETMEEAGISDQADIVQAAPILDPPCPYDAGTHVEIYGQQVAIMRGQPNPPAKEGIIPAKCQLIPLPYALDYLQRLRQEQYCVEGHALMALTAFNMKLNQLMLQDQTRQPQALLSGLP